jgi:hypothetical protein
MTDTARATALDFVHRVWPSEPDDIRRLKATSLPPGGRWSGVLFCNLIMLWTGQILGLQRSLVLDGSLPADVAVGLLASELRQLADWLAHWQMTDTCAMLRQVADEIVAEPGSSAQTLAHTIEGLMLAVNRMQNWTDAFVPWAQLDRLLPPLEK